MMSFAVRLESADDVDQIREVVTAAFDSPAIGELVDRIRASSEYRAELAMVAVDGERVIGHVMISGATLRNERGDRPIVMLSPLAVDPAVQGSGVGGALVRAVTDAARQAGESMVVLEGSPAYYSRFGIEPAGVYSITMPLPEWAPVEAAQVLWLGPREAAIAGHVVYPPTFDGID